MCSAVLSDWRAAAAALQYAHVHPGNRLPVGVDASLPHCNASCRREVFKTLWSVFAESYIVRSQDHDHRRIHV